MLFVNSLVHDGKLALKVEVVLISQPFAQPRLFQRTARGMECFGYCVPGLGTKTTETRCSSPSTPSDTSRMLYDSEQNPSRDRAGLALRFNIPTIIDGHVYVGAKREVDVYGLLPKKTAAK